MATTMPPSDYNDYISATRPAASYAAQEPYQPASTSYTPEGATTYVTREVPQVVETRGPAGYAPPIMGEYGGTGSYAPAPAASSYTAASPGSFVSRAPATSYGQPSYSYAQQPSSSYAQPSTSYGQSSYVAPSGSFVAQPGQSSYGQTSYSYAQPSSSYAQPSSSYAQPGSSYAQPSYGQYSYGYGGQPSYGQQSLFPQSGSFVAAPGYYSQQEPYLERAPSMLTYPQGFGGMSAPYGGGSMFQFSPDNYPAGNTIDQTKPKEHSNTQPAHDTKPSHAAHAAGGSASKGKPSHETATGGKKAATGGKKPATGSKTRGASVTKKGKKGGRCGCC